MISEAGPVEAVRWLSRAAGAVTAAQTAALAPVGLSPSAFTALLTLGDAPGQTLEPCELAVALGVSRPSMTGLLDTLESRRLVRRAPHATDRRRLQIVLTDPGRSLLEQHAPAYRDRQRALLADLSPAELAHLTALLHRLADSTHGSPP